jgi:hypothetical protein
MNGHKKVTMWMFVIILLNTVPGISTVTALQTYPTSQECHSERDRIGYEMAEAYPHERDFEIACRFNTGQQSKFFFW